MTLTVQMMLGGVALVAGFGDAIAGGGGLLTLPAVLLTGLPVPVAMATNKGQSVFGSGMALGRFYHSALLDKKRMLPAFCAGMVGAVAGVRCLALLPAGFLRPVVMALLAGVAVFMIFYKPPVAHVERAGPRYRMLGAAVIALGIGFYDGFFGPGTGTFLIMAFVLYFHDRLDEASANAKVVNFASNLGALAMFAGMGLVEWHVAAPMAVGQAIGGYAGAHVTIRHGHRLVRVALVVVSLALVARLGWQVLQ